MKLKIWSHEAIGTDGFTYGLRLLMTDEEIEGLQAAGILPTDICQIVGMQEAADAAIADIEKQAHVEGGGRLS